MSPRVIPKEQRTSRSSYAEYRSKTENRRDVPSFTDRDSIFWKYVLAPPVPGLEASSDDFPNLRPFLIDEHEQRALSRATGPAGGFIVPQDFADQIASARRARSVIAELAREVITPHGRSVPLPATPAHGAAAWTAEGAAVVPSDETFAQVSLGAHKATTKVVVSSELVRDALPSFDAYLADELGQRTAALEESAFAVGSGSGQPQGIATVGNGVSTVTAAVGSTTTFTLADLRSAFAALPAAYAANASWIMSPSAFLNAAGAVDTAGAPRIPSLHGDAPALFGRPVYISPELPVAAANARSVVVGDFQAGYAVRRVKGLGVRRQDELHSDNDQVAYLLAERVDGRVVLADALRILVHSAT